MFSGGIPNNGNSKSKVDPHGFCGLRVKANIVLCLQCFNWIHSRCARVKRLTPEFS